MAPSNLVGEVWCGHLGFRHDFTLPDGVGGMEQVSLLRAPHPVAFLWLRLEDTALERSTSRRGPTTIRAWKRVLVAPSQLPPR